jgi:PIN domain nuclease of toxin-antitoxin system
LNLLLDTHIFLWWDRDLSRLPRGVEDAIANPANSVTVSAISIFELALKRARGHLAFATTIEALVRHHKFLTLAVTPRHAEEAAALPPLHKDPFDRILIAQARLEQLTLVTNDAMVRRYSVTTL